MLAPSPDHILQSSFAAMTLTTLSLFHSDTHFSIGLEAKEEKGVNHSPVPRIPHQSPLPPSAILLENNEGTRFPVYLPVFCTAEPGVEPSGIRILGV